MCNSCPYHTLSAELELSIFLLQLQLFDWYGGIPQEKIQPRVQGADHLVLAEEFIPS